MCIVVIIKWNIPYRKLNDTNLEIDHHAMLQTVLTVGDLHRHG